jgi:hypothetical protein
MKTGQMEAMVRDQIMKFNQLPNKSKELFFEYDIMEKIYKLSCKIDNNTRQSIYETPYLAEMEGIVTGLTIANDYDWFGKSTKNPMYRFIVKPKGSEGKIK